MGILTPTFDYRAIFRPNFQIPRQSVCLSHFYINAVASRAVARHLATDPEYLIRLLLYVPPDLRAPVLISMIEIMRYLLLDRPHIIIVPL